MKFITTILLLGVAQGLVCPSCNGNSCKEFRSRRRNAHDCNRCCLACNNTGIKLSYDPQVYKNSALILYVNSKRTHALMLQGIYNRCYEGKWMFPGGQVDTNPNKPVDPTLEHAVVREFLEETGLPHFPRITNVTYHDRKHRDGTITRLFIAETSDTLKGFRLQKKEALAKKFRDVRELDYDKTVKYVLDGFKDIPAHGGTPTQDLQKFNEKNLSQLQSFRIPQQPPKAVSQSLSSRLARGNGYHQPTTTTKAWRTEELCGCGMIKGRAWGRPWGEYNEFCYDGCDGEPNWPRDGGRATAYKQWGSNTNGTEPWWEVTVRQRNQDGTYMVDYHFPDGTYYESLDMAITDLKPVEAKCVYKNCANPRGSDGTHCDSCRENWTRYQVICPNDRCGKPTFAEYEECDQCWEEYLESQQHMVSGMALSFREGLKLSALLKYNAQ